MSNSNHFAGRKSISTYGSAEISGESRVHQGDNNTSASTTVYTDTFIQEISLYGEIPTQETLNAFLRSQARLAPLNTSHAYIRERSRGRDCTRGGGNDTRRGSHHDTPRKHTFSRPRSPSSSRSPSSTRIPRPSFTPRGRRYSSLSRDSRRSDFSSPVSTAASSATSIYSFREQGETLLRRNNVVPSLSDASQPRLDKPLPWVGHLLDPHSANDTSSHDTPQSISDERPSPAVDQAIPPDRRHGTGLFLDEIRHLRLALDELEQFRVNQETESEQSGDVRNGDG